jgi:hypothetical protein
MLPAFATVAQLADRFPGGIGESDVARAQAALADASAKIRAEANLDWIVANSNPPALVANVPDVVVTIALAAALRAFSNPEQLIQEGIGTYHASYSAGNTDVYLTKQEIRLVRRAAANTGLWSKPTSRGRVETSMWPWEDIFLPTTLAGDPSLAADPIEWAGPDGF